MKFAARTPARETPEPCSTVVVPFTQQSINEVLHNSQRILEGVRKSAENLGTLAGRITAIEDRMERFDNPISDMTDGLNALTKVVEKYMARKANSSQSGKCHKRVCI